MFMLMYETGLLGYSYDLIALFHDSDLRSLRKVDADVGK